MITWSVIPGLKGVASRIRSCTVLIALIVGLSVVPVPETNKYYSVKPVKLLCKCDFKYMHSLPMTMTAVDVMAL